MEENTSGVKGLELPTKIDIEVSSDFGVKTLEELTRGSLYDLGKQIRVDTSYVGDTKQTRLKIQMHPTDMGMDLGNALLRIAQNIPRMKCYHEVMRYFEGQNQYLGDWKTDKYPLGQDVALYMKRGFEFALSEWGVSREELVSSSKVRDIARVRKAFFYALHQKFSNGSGRKDRLSTPDIGAILCKDHSTVVLALKEIKSKLGESKVKSPDLVEMVLREGVEALN
jgi:hypothetical protein